VARRCRAPTAERTATSRDGNPKRWWTDRHIEHTTAKCGRVVTTIGLAMHKRSCAVCNDG